MGDYNLFASYDRLGQVLTNYAKPNNPTLKCPSTSESYGGSYRLKAGLITADEVVLAGENPGVVSNSYLNIVSDGTMLPCWSMTPAVFGNGNASVWGEYEYLDYARVNDGNAVRPVINVTTVNGFASGDGTASDPYVLS